MPIVSIIMPVKNASMYLEACLQSICAQTFKDWELMAIDDHSTDNSPSILASAATADPRISWQPNDGMGIIPALQQAYIATTGAYITRMDADDLIPDFRLEKMVKMLETSPSKTVVTGLVKYFADGSVSDGYLKYEDWLNSTNMAGTQWQQVFRECVVASPNWMVRRDDLENMKAFDGLQYPEDYHLVLKWFVSDFRIQCLPDVTLYWREHADRTSRTSPHYGQEAFFDMKLKYLLDIIKPDDELVVWGKNRKAKLTTRYLDSVGVDYKSMQLIDYKKIEHFPNAKVLVAVYPDSSERKQLEAYMTTLGRHQGVDWWYL